MQTEFAVTSEGEITTADLVARFHWTQWAKRGTREGDRMHRSAPITRDIKGDFWKSWHALKSSWMSSGFSISKNDLGDWTINQWLTMEGTVSAGAMARAKEQQAAETEKFLPPDFDPAGVTLTTEQAKMLYPYQRQPAIRLKAALMAMMPPDGSATDKQLLQGLNGNALDASDTGTGKTIVALVVCAELGLKPCVIGPKAVIIAWQRAAKMLNVALGWVINYDKLRTGKSGLGRWKGTGRFAAYRDPVTFKTVSKEIMEFEFTYLPGNGRHILVFDEVQKCKSPDTKQGQILRDAALAGHKILGLSATAAKDPTEMRNLGAALGLHDGSAHGFAQFCKYYGCFEETYGWRFDWKAKKRLEELHRAIFPLRGQRIKVSEVPDFPETSITADALDTGHTDKIKAAYDEMDRKLADAAMKSAREKGSATLAAIMAARVASEAAKLDLFEDLAKEALDEGRSPLLFLNFREHIAILAERFKTKSIIWGTEVVRDGDGWKDGRAQSADERQRVIDDFQHDRTRIVLVSLQAGGAGISLHDQFNGNFPRSAFISPSYSAIDLKQALGRAHRAGAKTKSFQRIVFAAGTIEEEICASMRIKLANIETINDGALQPAGLAERLRGVKLEGETAAMV